MAPGIAMTSPTELMHVEMLEPAAPEAAAFTVIVTVFEYPIVPLQSVALRL